MRLQVATRLLPRAVDTEAAFLELYADAPDCFWLDSSRVQPGLSRFSFLGDGTGPLGERLTYRVADGFVRIRAAGGETIEPGSIFDVLDARLSDRHLDVAGLPFDFAGGYVGYLGYELKADCGGDAAYQAVTPDSAWLFADRFVAVDHEQDLTYIVAVHFETAADAAEAEQWMAATATHLAQLAPTSPRGRSASSAPAQPPDALEQQPTPDRGREQYLRDIARCADHLGSGDSYEICLTDTVTIPFTDRDELFYQALRHGNPAPYAAFLRLDEVSVMSSSPERFLSITAAGAVQSKPIKGTAPRSSDPAQDAALAAGLVTSSKTQAENLMIVDLLRNDLGQVCQTGTVAVAEFMKVESYATVHQLVSTISGQLRSEVSAVQCARHCFPGGSMTGAPKRRTMQIIDEIEGRPRGVYSGALGYFSLTGAADLSIVIRTAVRHGDQLTIGAGGAIVLDSDPADEYDEMILKTSALLQAWAASATTLRPATA